ncbi:hypothetical protein ACFLRH_02775 [Actinomycetota bacterium]
MGRVVRLLTVMTMLLAACGGGDTDADDTTTVVAGGEGSSTTTTTMAPTTTTTTAAPVDSGAGASGDFCGFLGDYIEDTDFSPVGLSAAGMEELFKDNLAAMQRARGLAPSGIEGDVALFVDAYGGFVEFMDDYGFNFLAISEDALDDPRLTALEDPALMAAGDRIEDFCGIEGEFIAAPPSSDGGSTGSGGGPPAASLPDDFPADLVPPGGVVVVALDIAGATSVTFDIESPTDDVIAFFSETVGDPTIQMNEPNKGALWTTQYEGSTVNIVVSEISPGMVQVNVIIE